MKDSLPSARTLVRPLISLAAIMALAACTSSSGTNQVNANSGAAPQARFDLANRCLALKSLASSAYAERAAGGYAATAPSLPSAEAFYAKPTALGRYLFYSKDRQLLSANGGTVAPAATVSDGAEWMVDTTAAGRFTLLSTAAGKSLAADGAGHLVLSDTAGEFGFDPDTDCTAYPEMPTGIRGQTYVGRGVDKPVIGFADAHTHMAMSNELSDGRGNVGPSAGGVLYGQMFNRFGVTEALKDCEPNHGPDGIKDASFIIEGTTPSSHQTPGWPGFSGWPVVPNLTHQTMYYRWLERAYQSGLRLMVNLGTNIQALCEVGVAAGLGQPGADCNDMSLGLKQIAYTYQLQDYVDAQAGGPGKGWFRIVTSPAQARSVINDGKLAVVLGLEFANILDCSVSFDALGNETDGCDRAHIDQRLDEVYRLGVRQIYLYHDVNNALGGTGIFSPVALNLIGYYGTHQFWKTYACPDVPYFGQDAGLAGNYVAGAELTASIPGTGSDPVTSLILGSVNGSLPVYPPGRQCNARGTTDLGRYAIQQAMRKGLVLDVDHAELSIKQDMITLAKQQVPVYPLVSMHGGHGGITLQMAQDILGLGGLIFPYNPNGADWIKEFAELKKIWPQGRPLAMGYGFDGNGFGGMPGPRGAGHPPIRYPFTLFSGPGWGPQFAAAGIQPLTVEQLTIAESGKSWNADVDGEPHYGLVADLVEEIRLEGGEEAVTALYNSAEAYLQMWERTSQR